MILIRLNASRPDDLRPAFQLTLDECVKLLRWQTSNIPILIAPFTVAADAISRNRRSDENNELRNTIGWPTWGCAKPPGKLGGLANSFHFLSAPNEMLEWIGWFRQNRCWLAMRAPSANAWNFVQITVGCTSVR